MRERVGWHLSPGACDDNASFEAYLAYLDERSELPDVLPVDVTERYVVTVMDGATEEAIPDAGVGVAAGAKLVATAQANAKGQFLFHPALYGVSAQATSFEYEVGAPPHLYEQAFTYVESVETAVQDGIRIHGVGASGTSEQAEYILRQLAQLTMGHFFFLTYSNDIPGKPGSGTGSGGEDGYSVGEYLAGSLDELVVQLVGRDVLALVGE